MDIIARHTTVETEAGLRIQRDDGILTVTDIRDAGKRGKRCRAFNINVWPAEYGTHTECCRAPFNAFLTALTEQPTYEAALSAARILVDEFEALGAAGTSEVYESTYMAVRVRPAGERRIVISGPKVIVCANSQTFSVSDPTDPWNEPMIIPGCHGGEKTGIKRFYAWCREHEAEISTMTFAEVWGVLSLLGARIHHYCAID